VSKDGTRWKGKSALRIFAGKILRAFDSCLRKGHKVGPYLPLIVDLISNQKLSEEISQAAYNTVVNHFSIDIVCKSLSQIYDAFDRKQ